MRRPRPLHRLKVWRYRRQLLAMGCSPARALPMARIAAGLDVPPRVIWTHSTTNHWSAARLEDEYVRGYIARMLDRAKLTQEDQ